MLARPLAPSQVRAHKRGSQRQATDYGAQADGQKCSAKNKTKERLPSRAPRPYTRTTTPPPRPLPCHRRVVADRRPTASSSPNSPKSLQLAQQAIRASKCSLPRTGGRRLSICIIIRARGSQHMRGKGRAAHLSIRIAHREEVAPVAGDRASGRCPKVAMCLPPKGSSAVKEV